MLTTNLKQEQLSIAYVHALAVKCGFEFDQPRIDNDSVDVFVSANGHSLVDDSILGSPKIDIQLKATTVWEVSEDGTITFDLKKKNYNDLIKRCVVPKILVVLCLPESEDNWISHSLDEVALRKCAYWISLKGLPETENEWTKRIFLKNHFNHLVLFDLLVKISKEEEL